MWKDGFRFESEAYKSGTVRDVHHVELEPCSRAVAAASGAEGERGRAAAAAPAPPPPPPAQRTHSHLQLLR